MQTRFRIQTILAAALLLALASCSKTNKQGRYAPKDAAIVMHIDGASLSSKLPWEEIKQNALFQEMYADTSVPAFAKKVLDNPDNSGIDTKTDLLFFAQRDSLGGIVALTGTVKDAEKFRQFWIDATEGGSENEKDGVKFISKAPVCVGWNKEKFVVISDVPELGMHRWSGAMDNAGSSLKSRDLMKTCKDVFDLKESNSLGDDAKFTELVKKPGDLHFWMNSEALNKNNTLNPALAMLNLAELYKGAFTTAAVNFENGKISVDAKSYAGKELSALYKKYGGKDIDEDMIKRLPSKDVAAVFAMSFKPEGIKEFLKLLGVEGYANMGLAFAGFSLDDFIKANKGDIMIALTGLTQKTKTDSIGGKEIKDETVQPDLIFASSIADKDAFNLLIKAGEKFGKDIPSSVPVAYNSNGKLFAIGNSKENIDKYFAGSNNNYDFLSKISGKPFGAYVNVQYILKALEKNLTADSAAKVVYEASLKTWDNVYMKGGEYEDGGITQTAEINFMDKNTNSLKQLNQYTGLVGKVALEEKKKHQEEIVKEPEVITYPPLSALGDSAKKHK
ncbi:DUF4836 family protein [Ferruginibacter sp.]